MSGRYSRAETICRLCTRPVDLTQRRRAWVEELTPRTLALVHEACVLRAVSSFGIFRVDVQRTKVLRELAARSPPPSVVVVPLEPTSPSGREGGST